MRPSAWLATLRATDFYPERKLLELEAYGIAFEPGSGLLRSRIEVGFPYSPYGRLAAAPLLTERQLMVEMGKLGLAPRFEWRGEDRLLIGFQVVTSVWRLLSPITREVPPSAFEADPEKKAGMDLAAIRGYGY